MRKAVDHAPLPEADLAPDTRPLRVIPPEDAAERALHDTLVSRLAADRIRDLRDDGVTLGYVARMYDVEPELLERVAAELVPSRRR